jgi:RNA polymerase sigma-70 factor (ECF subfamily)
MEGGLLLVAVRALGDMDEARDAVQETMARALEALRGNRVPVGVVLEAFVYGICRHVIADVQRRRVRERGTVGDVGALPAPIPSALDALVSAEERDAVARALAALPAADRDLLERCFVRGERVAAIAARQGEPAERIRKRKSRALERLREKLRCPAGGHGTPSLPTIAE